MHLTEFKLPELGENVHQGDLVRLMVAPGATVAEGQPVIELETDKAVVEVPSSVSGKVKDVLVKQGEKIKVGQVIFTLDNGSKSVARTSPEQNRTLPPQAKAEPASAPSAIPAAVPAAKAPEGVSPSRVPPAVVPSETAEMS